MRMFAVAGCIAILFAVSAPSRADTISDLIGAVPDLTLGKLVDRAGKTANNAIDNAANRADALEAKSADDLNILAFDTSRYFSGSLGVRLDQLTGESRAWAIRLLQLEQKVDNWVTAAYDIRDTTYIDVQNIEAGLPLTHVPEFQLVRIANSAYFKHGGDYNLVVYAHGIQTDSDQITTINATLNGISFPLASVDQSTLGKAVISLPGDRVRALFDQAKLTVLKLHLQVKVDRPGLGVGPLHPFRNVSIYDVPVFVSLYPDKAGTIAIHTTIPKYAWVDVGQQDGPSVNLPERGGCRSDDCKGHATIELRVAGQPAGDPQPGDRRIASAHRECSPPDNICNFVYNDGGGIIDQNGTHVQYIVSNNSHSRAVFVRGNIQEYRQVGVEQQTTQGDLLFTNTTQLATPTGSLLSTVEFSSFSGLNYMLPLQGPDPRGTVTFISLTPKALGPSKDVVLMRATPPQELN